MPATILNIHDVLGYHKPDDDGVAKIQKIRDAAEVLARAIFDYCPPCADQTAAIRHVREAMMTANASIVLKGMV